MRPYPSVPKTSFASLARRQLGDLDPGGADDRGDYHLCDPVASTDREWLLTKVDQEDANRASKI